MLFYNKIVLFANLSSKHKTSFDVANDAVLFNFFMGTVLLIHIRDILIINILIFLHTQNEIMVRNKISPKISVGNILRVPEGRNKFGVEKSVTIGV